MDDSTSPAQQPAAHRAWWLVTRRRRTEWQSLIATGSATFTGRSRSHFEAVQPGDPVFLYVSRPDHAILAVATVSEGGAEDNESEQTSPQSTGERELSQIGVQLAFEIPNSISWRDIVDEPELAEAEPVRQRSSGTLFSLSEAEYSALQLLALERNPELASAFSALDAGAQSVSNYGVADESGPQQSRVLESPAKYAPPQRAATLPTVRDLAELQAMTSLPFEWLEEVRDLLEDFGQIILTGPPGTGKTWLARGLAVLAAGDPERVQVVQFHPSTSYEDFIEGLKPQVDPRGSVTYAVLPGVFVRFCEAARADPDHHYVLVIDEINRAPLARVFGELLYALEYRGPHGSVQLSTTGGMSPHAEEFYVPENVLLIGTMNTADRSLSNIDHALRRRFRFIEVEPAPQVLEEWLQSCGTDAEAIRVMLRLLERVNARLSEMIDPDHRLGHTYFMLDPMNSTTLYRLWRTAIRPLLTEYFMPPGGELDEFRLLFSEAIMALRAQGD